MIGEAVDTAITLARALAAWIVLLAAVASLALWTVLLAAWGLVRAVRGAWRGSVGPSWRVGRLKARMVARARVRGSDGRLRLREARVPRTDTGATPPPRPLIHRQNAPHGDSGPFPTPGRPEPSDAHTADPDQQEAA